MKTKELKRIAKENDYILSRPFGDFTLTEGVGENYIDISGDCENKIWLSIPSVCGQRDFNMIKAALEFAETPLEEREEEKKYYCKHRWARTKNGGGMYMSLRKTPNISHLTLQGANKDIFEYQVRFTQKEIDEIKEKYDTNLSDFEIIEVE